MPRFLSPVSLALATVLPIFSAQAAVLPLPNNGFENGLEGWTAQNAGEAIKVAPEAASLGKMGLRVQGGPAAKGAVLSSAEMPAQAGQTYRISFWGKRADLEKTSALVTLVFLDGGEKKLEPGKAVRLYPFTGMNYPGGFEKYLLGGIAPEGTAKMQITIQAQGKGVGYLDDFAIEQVESDASTVPVDTASLEKEVAADPHREQAAPRIVLKVDDLATNKDKDAVHERWNKFVDFIKQRKIKVGIGMLANSLEGDKPAYGAWLKDLLATGQVEFWLHAYDHESHLIDGKLYPEFNGLSPEEQKARIAKCQALAKEKLGQPFRAFGPPGQGGIPAGLPPTTPLGSWKTAMDENTLAAIANDGDLKTIMYPSPLDDAGLKTVAEKKVTILRRVFAVNLENPVFTPNYAVFLEGYAHNRGQDYFVLQGHPKQWDDAKFTQFVKIVDFLTAQGASFVTPTEAAAAAAKN